MNRGFCGDFNSSLDHGYYAVSSTTNNTPPNAYTYGLLEVFGSANFTVQRYTPHANYSGNYGEYTRVKYNDTWGEWRFIPYQQEAEKPPRLPNICTYMYISIPKRFAN